MFTAVMAKSVHTLMILWDCDGRYRVDSDIECSHPVNHKQLVYIDLHVRYISIDLHSQKYVYCTFQCGLIHTDLSIALPLKSNNTICTVKSMNLLHILIAEYGCTLPTMYICLPPKTYPCVSIYNVHLLSPGPSIRPLFEHTAIDVASNFSTVLAVSVQVTVQKENRSFLVEVKSLPLNSRYKLIKIQT